MEDSRHGPHMSRPRCLRWEMDLEHTTVQSNLIDTGMHSVFDGVYLLFTLA